MISAPVSFNALFARFRTFAYSVRRGQPTAGYLFGSYRIAIAPEANSNRLTRHPAKDEGIGLGEVLGRVTMQVFVRGYCTMIAASVQCDIDGISKGSHDVLLKWT